MMTLFVTVTHSLCVLESDQFLMVHPNVLRFFYGITGRGDRLTRYVCGRYLLSGYGRCTVPLYRLLQLVQRQRGVVVPHRRGITGQGDEVTRSTCGY